MTAPRAPWRRPARTSPRRAVAGGPPRDSGRGARTASPHGDRGRGPRGDREPRRRGRRAHSARPERHTARSGPLVQHGDGDPDVGLGLGRETVPQLDRRLEVTVRLVHGVEGVCRRPRLEVGGQRLAEVTGATPVMGELGADRWSTSDAERRVVGQRLGEASMNVDALARQQGRGDRFAHQGVAEHVARRAGDENVVIDGVADHVTQLVGGHVCRPRDESMIHDPPAERRGSSTRRPGSGS